jgi:hypothetical protein
MIYARRQTGTYAGNATSVKIIHVKAYDTAEKRRKRKGGTIM